MSLLYRSFLLILSLFLSLWATPSILSKLTITTQPALQPGLAQSDYAPQKYEHGQLPLAGSGYYSLEGFVAVDSLLKDPGLYVGSTAYPLDVYINNKLVYRWGQGGKSHHFVDYRSHGFGVELVGQGLQKFRVDFWCTGETFAMPALYFGERIDVVNRASVVSFFNSHLLNGILVAAIFIAILFGGNYLVSGRKEKEVLYFALFSLTLVLALLIFPLNSQQFEEVPLFKLARIGTLFLPFWMLMFVRSYCSVWDKSRLLFWIPLGFTLVVSQQILLTDGGKVGINKLFNTYGSIILDVEFVIVLVILIRSFYTKRKSEIALITGGFLLFIVTALHDLHYLSAGILPLFW